MVFRSIPVIAYYLTAIRKVSLGGKYISPTIAERLAFYVESDTEKQPHERLSNREYQVMCMICSGKSTKDISEELCLSLQSISTYRSRILEKMNIENNTELILYAVKNNLID